MREAGLVDAEATIFRRTLIGPMQLTHALLVPAIEDRATRLAAAASAVAVIALDPLPMRLSLICAGLTGIAVGLLAETRGPRPAR